MLNNLYVPTTATELWIFLAVLAAGFSAIFCSLGFVIRKAWVRGKPLVFMVPEVPGLKGDMRRRRFIKGEFKVKIEGSDGQKERNIAQDSVCIPTNMGPVWLIGQSTGWNLVAPNKDDKPKVFDSKRRSKELAAEEVSEDVYARMLVATPLAYEQAIEQNDFADFVNSKQEKDPWQVRIAGLFVLVIMFGLVTAGGVVFLITKLHQGG